MQHEIREEVDVIHTIHCLRSEIDRCCNESSLREHLLEPPLLVCTTADYIDLLLVHEPYAEYISMYQALEEAYAQGKIRAIGISNINRRLYDQLLSVCKVVPMVNQVESHVYYPQLSYQKYLQEKGTVMESWAPFTEGRRRIFTEPVLMEIAQKYQKTVGQIALKYLSQNGIIVIPKTAKEERMKENISLFGFSLDESDLHQIRKLDEGKSLFGWYEP